MNAPRAMQYAGEWAEGEWPPAHALAGALTPERTTQDQQQPASAVSTSAPGSRAASGGLWTARQQETPQVRSSWPVAPAACLPRTYHRWRSCLTHMACCQGCVFGAVEEEEGGVHGQ